MNTKKWGLVLLFEACLEHGHPQSEAAPLLEWQQGGSPARNPGNALVIGGRTSMTFQTDL